jgi:hypothetical protein
MVGRWSGNWLRMSPRRIFQSMGLTLAPATFTLICRGPGWGSSTSVRASFSTSP